MFQTPSRLDTDANAPGPGGQPCQREWKHWRGWGLIPTKCSVLRRETHILLREHLTVVKSREVSLWVLWRGLAKPWQAEGPAGCGGQEFCGVRQPQAQLHPDNNFGGFTPTLSHPRTSGKGHLGPPDKVWCPSCPSGSPGNLSFRTQSQSSGWRPQLLVWDCCWGLCLLNSSAVEETRVSVLH